MQTYVQRERDRERESGEEEGEEEEEEDKREAAWRLEETRDKMGELEGRRQKWYI
jgi:hypothetical protein